MRLAVRRRLRFLGALEFADIGLLGGMAFGALDVVPTVANVTGFGLAASILAQGGTYWMLKSHQLSRLRSRPRGMAVFGALRTADVGALVAGAALIGPAVVAAPGRPSLPGLAFYALAWLEYVNYFHRQLAYDTVADLRRLRRTRRWRRSPLARDLHRVSASPRPPASGFRRWR